MLIPDGVATHLYRPLIVFAAAVLLLPAQPSASDEREPPQEGQRQAAAENPEEEPAEATAAAGWVFRAAPPANFYPHYIADPIRAQSAMILLGNVDSEIPDSGDARFGLRLGGRFAMFRVHPRDDPDVGWQLDFEGGFSGHFDIDHSLDNIGWDGFFGLQLSWKPTQKLGFRFGTLHDSAHVGDEYSERTGRERIGYTREEFILGVSLQLGPRWRVYGEGGYGFGLKEFQEALRFQAGLEYFGRRRFFSDQLGWYAAVDLRAYDENDWDSRVTAQIGLMLPFSKGTGRYRFALEYANGRSALGEFSFREESYIGFGWYFDF
jgi:hypothetical protein